MTPLDDAALTALLIEPDVPVDDAFVAGIARAVVAETRLVQARRRSWVRFGWDMAAGASVLGVVALLSVLSDLGHRLPLPLAGGGMTAALVLGLWCALSLSAPASGGRLNKV